MSFFRFVKENLPFLSAGFLLMLSSSYGQTFFISIFAGEIRNAFGLSHGAWGAIYSAGTMASAIVMIWAGGLTDRFRVRVLARATLLILAAACLAMAAAPGAWALPFVIFALRFSGQGMTSHTAVVAMARWFVGARGRALSFASLGIATGESILPLTFVALMPILSWRGLWVVAALLALAVLPVVARLLRLERTPQQVAHEGQSSGMSNRHWFRREVLSHWLFWFLMPSLLAPAAFSTAFFFQQVHLAETKGWAHMQLVALFPVFTAAAIASMVASGWLIDRVGSGRLMPFFQIPMALGFVLMSAAESLVAATVAVICMGITQGANSTAPNAFWAEYYGTANLGSIKAMAAAVMVLGTAIGPGLTGLLIDMGLIFEDQMIGIAVYFLIGAGLAFIGIRRARPYLAMAS